MSAPGQSVCEHCRADLPWIRCRCGRCGTPLASPLPPGVYCGACQQNAPPFVEAFAPLHYGFPVDAIIKALKFGRRLDLAPLLADCMLPWLVQQGARFDAMVPVPLHRWRNARRGFNQADEIARHLRAATGMPILNCVRRVRSTRTQSGLDFDERQGNMHAAFHAAPGRRCRHALLVDDVMTTGATVRELSCTLLDAGFAAVSVLTAAHASPRQAAALTNV